MNGAKWVSSKIRFFIVEGQRSRHTVILPLAIVRE